MGREQGVVEITADVRLPYVRQGDPGGQAVLLLHAYGDSWRAVEPIMDHLPPTFDVIAPTLRGHGDASKPTDGHDTPTVAADLVALLDALDVERVALVAASSSGLLARRIAAEQPARVSALVMLGAPLTLRDKTDGKLAAEIRALTDPVPEAFARTFLDGIVVRPVDPELADTLVAENLKVPARIWRAAFDGLVADDSDALLGEIKAPTLIVWGQDDAILSRAEQETMAAAIVGAQLLVYEGAGHAFYWEDPARVAADVAAFLEQLS